MAGRRARPGPLHRPARRARLQGLSVPDGSSRGDRNRAGALPVALPRRRRLCRDERDDALRSGLVRQCDRHDPGAARLLPLAVRADRAAGGGLFGAAVLHLRVPRASRTPHQYGCSDQHRHRAGARHVAGRNVSPCRACLFRRGADADHLSGRRPLSRPEHAPADSRGGRKSRGIEGGDGDQVRRRR